MKKLYFYLVPIFVFLLIAEFDFFNLSNNIADSVYYPSYTLFCYLWLSSPLLWLFFFLRLFRIRALLAFHLTSFLYISLELINHKKIELTRAPLSYNDLVSGYNILISLKFVPLISYFIFALAVVYLFFIYRSEKKQFGKEPFRVSNLIMLALISPFCFYIYIQNDLLKDTPYYSKIVELTQRYDVDYTLNKWSENFKEHGLPMHLVQTSSLPLVPRANAIQQQKFIAYNAKRSLYSDAPKTIIYILCESCWYDSNHLRPIYQPLLNLGFAESRAISPVFGGGTANSEFEMLTGLPSVSPHIAGIVYQEYRGDIRNHADTLPHRLLDNGYITYAAHNDSPEFYYRNLIYPKFDLSEYQSINDMAKLPKIYQDQREPWQESTDDFILFDSAIKRLRNAKGHKIFMHLLTMNTHGPYYQRDDNDDGSYAYSVALKQSISRIAQFSKQVEAIDPNALIVIYGDHKPPIPNYFINNNILTSSDLSNGPAKYGDVPVLIKTSDKDKLQQLLKESDRKPFYCLTNAVDSVLIGARPFSFNIMQEKGCLKPGPYDYYHLSNSAPNWLYGVSLF